MDNYPYVLSLIEGHMGHRTYGNLMRDYFSQHASCKVDFYWYNEERELTTRILNRLLSFYFPNQWVENQNLDFHRFRIESGFGYMARRLATRKLRHVQYSVLHFHSQVLALLSVELIKRLPTVVSIDQTAVQASQEKTHPNYRWTFAPNILLEKRVFEAAAQVVAFSEWARSSVIEDYKIDEKKVNVIYSGVDTNAIPYGKSELHALRDRSEKNIQQRYNILFVGGDFKRKGGEDVLDVFLTTLSESAELHLVTQTPIECQHPNVHIYNTIKPYTPEWLKLYHQADVFVMPTYGDAFATVFMEAMAAGLPVIATRLSQIIEVVSHRETGFLIQPGDRHDLACRLRDLIENPNLGREMGAKGRLVAEQKFNTQKNFQTLETIFREISVDLLHKSWNAP
ncbi:MAG TPA: glycosyltransferase family 4 protein [Coleofasciculaceae cyanobacterium]